MQLADLRAVRILLRECYVVVSYTLMRCSLRPTCVCVCADNFSMVGAFVLANNRENLNMDSCLWYFGGIGSSLKAVYFGHANKKCTSVSGVLQNGQFISLLMQTFQF